jgi:hypothetical protein
MSAPVAVDILNIKDLLEEYGFTPENCDPVIINQLLALVSNTTSTILEQSMMVQEVVGNEGPITTETLSYVIPVPVRKSPGQPSVLLRQPMDFNNDHGQRGFVTGSDQLEETRMAFIQQAHCTNSQQLPLPPTTTTPNVSFPLPIAHWAKFSDE